MDLFDLVAKITLDSSAYEKGVKSAEEGASALSSKWSTFGKVAGVAGAATIAAVGAAAAGVTKLTKKSIEAYANYEQLAGGVKKLYGDASDEVMKFANEAYKTSGMSANQYMEQATSFSAALINSLNGDASKAAKQTDVAMRAISDNFNTFGGDIQNVQNAFQGFAKQNYSMLDNLKLGYGGTKTEMARLVEDANEYAKTIGMAGDLSMDSFSDIVTAIDLIQKKQGIAGTTAKEAATTIEGSLNMTKSAWENLVAGFANPDADLNKLMDNLVVAIVGDKQGEGLLNNIIPAVQRAIEGVAEVIQKAAPILAEQFPVVVENVLPTLIQAAATLIAGIVSSLPSLITVLVKQMPMIIKTLAKALISAGSQLLSVGKQLINKLLSGISSAFSTLVGKVKSLAAKIPQAIQNGIGSLFSIGSSVIQGLWNGLKSKWDALISWFSGAIDGLKEKAKKILNINSPSKVFMEIGKSIPEGLALGIEKNMNTVYDASDALADATTFTPQVSTTNENIGGGGDIIINLDYNAGEDANTLVRDIARGINRYRMAGVI